MRLPIRTLGLAAAALLVGTALAPVSAQQQQSGVDGQVALRSDGALFLILNGQRRWVATVVATDEDINSLPEGDPVMSGLALSGSVQAQPTGSPAAPPSGASGSSSGSGGSGSTGSGSSSASRPSSAGGEELSTDIPISVDVEGETKIKRGDSRKVEIKTKPDATCELALTLPDDKDERAEDSKNADAKGVCKYTIEIPDDAKEGDATLVGKARVGGKVNVQEIPLKIVKK